LLRAANRGITAVIDPHGRVVDTIEPFRAGMLRVTVRGYTGGTPYARVGNYLVVGLALVVLVAQLAVARAAARRRAA
jgi:apolipoprotein N-acyltransferase